MTCDVPHVPFSLGVWVRASAIARLFSPGLNYKCIRLSTMTSGLLRVTDQATFHKQ